MLLLLLLSAIALLTKGDAEGLGRGAAGRHVPPDARHEASVQRNGETLVFDEEFDEFNLDLWKHEITMGGGGNWEFQVYGNNRTNSYVEDGKLFLQPTLTSDFIGKDHVCGAVPTTLDIWGLVPADQCTSNMFYGCSRASDQNARVAINPAKSARVRTAGTFSFRYGRIEVKAKLPMGDWLWPAIWLLPEHNAYGSWPASGEIDIMESRGNAPPYVGGVEESSSAMHWGPHYRMDSWDMSYGKMKLDSGTFNDDFHTFGLYWDETHMYTYVDSDDKRLVTVNFDTGPGVGGMWKKGRFDERYPGMQNPWKGRGGSAPYDQRFYIVMNVAVGGVNGFFPDGAGGKMWANSDPDAAMKFHEATDKWFSTWDGTKSAMQVESVKVWQTEPDYFLDAAAAAAAWGTSTPTYSDSFTSSSELGGVPEQGNQVAGVGTSEFLVYLGCALIGATLGGFGVGTVLQRQNSNRWSKMHATFEYGSDGTPRSKLGVH